jgi:hypothetical protein
MTTITVKGTVDPITPGYGIDTAGIFGPPGSSLANLDFVVVWTGENCNCSRTPDFNPITDATLTISGVTFDFGPGNFGNIFRDDLNQVQTITPEGNLFSLTTDYHTARGVFYIPGQGGTTQAFLHITSVPGPVLGEGFASFLLLLLGMTILCKTRTIFVDNPSRPCHDAGYGPFTGAIPLAKP